MRGRHFLPPSLAERVLWRLAQRYAQVSPQSFSRPSPAQLHGWLPAMTRTRQLHCCFERREQRPQGDVVPCSSHGASQPSWGQTECGGETGPTLHCNGQTVPSARSVQYICSGARAGRSRLLVNRLLACLPSPFSTEAPPPLSLLLPSSFPPRHAPPPRRAKSQSQIQRS